MEKEKASSWFCGRSLNRKTMAGRGGIRGREIQLAANCCNKEESVREGGENAGRALWPASALLRRSQQPLRDEPLAECLFSSTSSLKQITLKSTRNAKWTQLRAAASKKTHKGPCERKQTASSCFTS